MKKICSLLIILLLVGCTLGNTPTSRVEDLLTKYQMLDKSIVLSYTDLTNDDNLSQNQKDKYLDLIRAQYRNLSYEIKDEKIDGDSATVEVSIKVSDYKSAIDKYNKSDYTKDRYHELVIGALRDTNDKNTYTVEFKLTKQEDGNWAILSLDREIKDKLLGIN